MMLDTAIEPHDQLMFWMLEETVVPTYIEKKENHIQFGNIFPIR